MGHSLLQEKWDLTVNNTLASIKVTLCLYLNEFLIQYPYDSEYKAE